MNIYQTARNAALALCLVASENTRANELNLMSDDDRARQLHLIEGDNLANKILQYEGVKKKEGKSLTRDETAQETTTYTIAGLPRLNAQGGLPLTLGAKLNVGRIIYRDIAPYGPSNGDELQYTIRITYEDGSRKKITATDVRSGSSWSTKKGQQQVLQKSDTNPSATMEGYRADIIYVSLLVDITVEEQLRQR